MYTDGYLDEVNFSVTATEVLQYHFQTSTELIAFCLKEPFCHFLSDVQNLKEVTVILSYVRKISIFSTDG